MKKIIAMYLPQFHAIPENDEWWGKGFTEWTNTKKALPLYKNHYQPKEPLDDKYYNLLDDDVKIWQCELAKKYGIYGFCYYHYWFKGKMLLEKPMEQMLNNKKIDLPFCISWANEPWARNWDGMEKQVLMKQEYGNESDWEEHFNYLNNFFKDDRYIKIDNKPLLVIYRMDIIDCHEDMIKYWNKLAIQNGFDGVYIVETLSKFQKDVVSKYSESAFYFEPSYTGAYEYGYNDKVSVAMRKFIPSLFRGQKYIKTMDYDVLYKHIINRKRINNSMKYYYGAFVSWDNTSRRGSNGAIIEGSTPKKFQEYLNKILQKSDNDDFIFINAWNEWAEGTYLEPDKRYGHAYLQAIKEALDNEQKK